MHTLPIRAALPTAAGALSLVLSSAAFAYGEADAIRDCESRIRSEYSLSDLRDAQAVKLNDSSHHYKVKGQTKIDGKKHPWDCEVKDRHVTAINYNGPKEKGMSGAQKLAIGAAAAIAAGVLASQSGSGGSADSTYADDREGSHGGGQKTAGHDATASLPCSMNKPTHNKQCRASVTRGKRGSATVLVTNPAGIERTLHFKAGDVTTNSGDLDWGKDGDTWFIGIDNREFYVVPEAFIVGG